MLKFFHRYQKSILGLIIGGMICISMLGFGVNFGGGGGQEMYAVKVNDQEVSFDEFYRRKRQVEERYRQFFGDRYWSMAPQLLKNLTQNLSDGIVDELLVLEDAQAKELFVGDSQVRDILLTQVFPQGFNKDQYVSMLRQMGMNSFQFERQLADDALQEQYRGILEDLSFASKKEAQELLFREKTEYDVSYVEIDSKSLVEKLDAPEESVLREFYEDNATDFETPPQVEYNFVSFDPAENLDLVNVLDEDVEFYYADNQREFRTPEKVKARYALFNFPVESDPAKMDEVRTRAEEAHAKAQAGEDFGTIVSQYSDDVTTKLTGGELGWVTRGSRSKEFDEQAFKLKQPGLVDLIETESGFELVMIDEYEESSVKDIEEVKEEIVKKIKQLEAPAFTAARADELLEKWSQEKTNFEDFTSANDLELQSSEGLRAKGSDPVGFPGLTARVLELGPGVKQVVDLRDKSFLVEVAEYRDVEIPAFDSIKEKILAQYKQQEAEQSAYKLANSIVEEISGSDKALAALAKEKGLEEQEQTQLSLTSGAQPPFTNADLRKEIEVAVKAPSVPSAKHLIDGKYYIAQVMKIHRPDEAVVAKEIGEYQTRAGKMLAQNLYQSMINDLKNRSEIDINPSVLAQ